MKRLIVISVVCLCVAGLVAYPAIAGTPYTYTEVRSTPLSLTPNTEDYYSYAYQLRTVPTYIKTSAPNGNTVGNFRGARISFEPGYTDGRVLCVSLGGVTHYFRDGDLVNVNTSSCFFYSYVRGAGALNIDYTANLNTATPIPSATPTITTTPLPTNTPTITPTSSSTITPTPGAYPTDTHYEGVVLPSGNVMVIDRSVSYGQVAVVGAGLVGLLVGVGYMIVRTARK